jgi:flagellar protein FlbD
VIILTRLNGTQVGLNPDLIERVEASGDTVVALIDGTRYVVSESCAEIVDRVVEFRARVLAAADAGLEQLEQTHREHTARDHTVRERSPRHEAGPLRLVVERDDAADVIDDRRRGDDGRR